MKYLQRFWLLLATIIFFSSCDFSSKETIQGDYVLRDSLILYKGKRPNTVTVHFSSEPPSLHPLIGANNRQVQIRQLLWQRLADVDLATGQMVPTLAAALPEISADGLSYSYTIHEAATWDDGKPITAADVVFSAKMALCPLVNNPELKVYLEGISEIKADEGNIRRVNIRFSERYILNDYIVAALPVLDARIWDANQVLAPYSLSDWKAAAYKKDAKLAAWAEDINGPALRTNIARLNGGSGPYKLLEWLPGQQIVLERKANYWGKALAHPFHHQKPEKLIFRIVPEDKTAEALIKQQELDVSTSLSTDAYLALNESETAQMHYHIGTQARDGLVWMPLNTRPEATGNAACMAELPVRKAIAMAVPVQQIIDGLYHGLAVRSSQPLSKLHPDHNPALPLVNFDLAAAARTLDEAGWKPGPDGIRTKVLKGKNTRLSFVLTVPAGRAIMEELGRSLSGELKKAGIECKVEPIEFGKMTQKISSHQFDAALIMTTVLSTPYDFKQLWHSASWATGSNFTGFGNPAIDKLIEEARIELDAEKRKQLNTKILAQIYADIPGVFMFNLPAKYAIHKRFNNAKTYFIPEFLYLGDLEMIPYQK